MDRLSAEHDPALFADGVLLPRPLPGRPHAGLDLRPRRPPACLGGPAAPGRFRRSPSRPGRCRPTASIATAVSRGTCRRSPGRPTATGSPASSPPAGASAPASGSSPRTAPRSTTSPRAPRRSRWAPGRPAGAGSGSRSSARGTGDGVACLVDVRDGTSTMLTSGPAALVCAVSGDGMRAVVRVGRRGARRLELFDLRSGRCTQLLPGGEANVADARFGITGGQLFVHSDAGGERPALLAVGLNRDAEPSLPYLVAGRDDARSRPRRARPGGGARRAGVERRRPQRGRPAGPALRDHRAAPPAAGRRRHLGGVHPRRACAADRQRGPDGPADDHPDRARPRASEPTASGPTRSRPLLPAAPRDAGHLVDPVLHHFPGEDGLPLSGWLFRPASAFGAVPTLHLAARRPGGPGTPDLPAAVPGAARRGRRGVRAERARLRRVRPHVLPGRRPGPAVRRDHRRARRRHVAGRARRWPTRRGSACPAGRTAAT